MKWQRAKVTQLLSQYLWNFFEWRALWAGWTRWWKSIILSSSRFVCQCASTFRELEHNGELFLSFLFAHVGELFRFNLSVDGKYIYIYMQERVCCDCEKPEFLGQHDFPILSVLMFITLCDASGWRFCCITFVYWRQFWTTGYPFQPFSCVCLQRHRRHGSIQLDFDFVISCMTHDHWSMAWRVEFKHPTYWCSQE